MPLRRILRDHRTGRRRPGERQVIDAGVRGERAARLAPESGDDIERALGESDFRREFRDPQQRQARVLGRLDHAGVARRERPADAAPEDLHRIVPRDDVPGHAVRLAPGQHRVTGRIGNRLAVQLVGRPRVELEVARAGGGIGPRLLHRLAAVARLDPREFVGVIRDRARQRHQLPPAFGGRELSPCAVERRARGLHRGVDVGRVTSRDRRERLAVRRVDHRQFLAGQRRAEGAGDEVAGGGADRERRMGGVHAPIVGQQSKGVRLD